MHDTLGISGRTSQVGDWRLIGEKLPVDHHESENSNMTLLRDHFEVARHTDQLLKNECHLDTLALGLVGEIGGVLAECKKGLREGDAYPHHRNRLTEELGDVLWYLLRLIDVLQCDLDLLDRLFLPLPSDRHDIIHNAIALGITGSQILGSTRKYNSTLLLKEAIENTAKALANMVASANVTWEDIVKVNRDKVLSRWPKERKDKRVKEVAECEEERFPAELCIEFREVKRGRKDAVILRCHGLNLGDRLTDNMEDPDYYRFHDVFHFSYAVLLGWSPVLRSLLKCKRKSCPDIDENQDGARAQVIEEAVSAYIFSHAKKMNFFEGIGSVDFELLKTIYELVRGYEVETVPLYHWEEAILEGYQVFRQLRRNHGGFVELNFKKRKFLYRHA